MTTLEDVREWDAADPLGGFRDRFALPDGVVYLDGNSLGALPKATAARLKAVVEQEWGEGLIRSWNDRDWVGAPRRVGAKIARLIGAEADEVIVADSTSVCLFKLLMAAAQLRDGAILAESDNFPTDAHVAGRVAELLGREFRSVPRDRIGEALTPDVAAAVITHVDYRTARRHDMRALTARGTRIVWDLSHSAGAVPLDLARDGIELAVGCGYKYLNGGPGAPAFLYVQGALLPQLRSPIAGWWGHAAPFDFSCAFEPAPDISRFLSGTPAILGLLALESGIDLMLEADPAQLWDKAIRLHDLFAARVTALCPELENVTPADPDARGSHIAFAHPHALAIVRALIARGVIGDFRTPDIARFGLTPLTLRYEDVWQATGIIADVMTKEAWRDPQHASGGVVP
ncbi:MAG TPA: aminotransferase class V-fold PLP-dependent enzyme [Sphingomonas sp.]|uniref:kynureninase n=1 Tax=Sphingomonas sp. TaxID=28214 RepID=UPI002C98EB3F|nr:aminotransferase class V-fold PLP-dependent enzyme [Sphingomonas sp.]HMI20216.1 aminotransferase class V-fold PLP-dependent enzyme [Sphingomonas sp.]